MLVFEDRCENCLYFARGEFGPYCTGFDNQPIVDPTDRCDYFVEAQE